MLFMTDLPPAEQNATRAEWAEDALDTFTQTTFRKSFSRALKDGDGEDALADLLCGLRHLAKAKGLDFADLDRRGAANFAHEDAPEYQGD